MPCCQVWIPTIPIELAPEQHIQVPSNTDGSDGEHQDDDDVGTQDGSDNERSGDNDRTDNDVQKKGRSSGDRGQGTGGRDQKSTEKKTAERIADFFNTDHKVNKGQSNGKVVPPKFKDGPFVPLNLKDKSFCHYFEQNYASQFS